MRACEGCRRRKIKCDAATNNTWPCSACIRLKLHCVRPNGYEGSTDASGSDVPLGADQFQQMPMQQQQQMMQPGSKPAEDMYAPQAYADAGPVPYGVSPYGAGQQPPPPQAQQHQQHPGMHYQQQPIPVMDPSSYGAQGVFPTPPPIPPSQIQEPSPEAYSSPDSYGQHDLSDLLGNLKVDEKGTGIDPNPSRPLLVPLALTSFPSAVST